jgi:hypothetical protein
MKNLFTLILLMLIFNFCGAQSLIVYPAPKGIFYKASDTYSVKITQNGVVKTSFVYKSSAGNGVKREWGSQQNNNFHFTIFSFSSPIIIEVVKFNSTATSAVIRPNRLGIGKINTQNQNENKKISFKLNKPSKVSVEFDDDTAHRDALMIFADTMERISNVPKIADSNVLVVNDSTSLKNIPSDKSIAYFKPGKYKIGYWNIPSNIKQVYIAGGAYVMGYLNRQTSDYNSDNSIQINGRGVLSNEGYKYHYPSNLDLNNDDDHNKWYKPINIIGGKHNIIEGITIIESTSYNMYFIGDNTLVDNVNINGFRWNNDGISPHGNGIIIKNCFIRVNDDAIVPYCSDLNISNCVFWELQGSVIQLGWAPHSMHNITVNNCDVIHDHGALSDNNIGFINAMNVTAAKQTATIDNVNVSNIYFDTPILRFLDIRGDRKSNAVSSLTPWIYSNFHFNNIHFSGAPSKFPLVFLHGYSNDHSISNFTFDNIYINEAKISSEKLDDSLFINKKAVLNVQIR